MQIEYLTSKFGMAVLNFDRSMEKMKTTKKKEKEKELRGQLKVALTSGYLQ
jgi:hypothetical protein